MKDGERWRKVLQTCPEGCYLLGIDLFSDAVMAGAVSRLRNLLNGPCSMACVKVPKPFLVVALKGTLSYWAL